MNEAQRSAKQNLSLIVAVSENGVIGRSRDLPWHISADLKRFRRLTTGHHIIMGRKTFDSIGRLLPDRKTVIVTRDANYHFEGASVVSGIDAAIQLTKTDDQPFVVGGGEIYRLSLPYVDSIFVTRVHAEIDGDTFFPEVDWEAWQLIESERFEADNKNEFDYSFQTYSRIIDASSGQNVA